MKTLVRTQEHNDSIAKAEAASPKVRMTKDYGPYKAGSIQQLSKAKRDYLVSQGFAEHLAQPKGKD